jgi:hypothetical protein
MVLGNLKEIVVPVGDSEMNPQPAFVVALEKKTRIVATRQVWSRLQVS